MANFESLCVVRIHNNEEIQPAIKSAELLQDLCIQNGITFTQLEVFKQSEFITANSFQHPRLTLIRRREFQRKVELEWARYLGQNVWLLGALKSFLSLTLYSLNIFFRKAIRCDEIIKMQIEKAVTSKHIAAMENAIQSGEDYIIVLESDASIHAKSVNGITSVLNIIQKFRNENLYVNLAGGIDRNRLGLSRLEITNPELRDFVQFRLPVTNTNCAYGLSRFMAEELIAHVKRDKSIQELSCDWLLNDFFMMHRPGWLCLHNEPPSLLHGSFEGVTASWNKRNRH